jgi:hypothetical protein
VGAGTDRAKTTVPSEEGSDDGDDVVAESWTKTGANGRDALTGFTAVVDGGCSKSGVKPNGIVASKRELRRLWAPRLCRMS